MESDNITTTTTIIPSIPSSDKIGKGSYSTVYKEEECAVKKIMPDSFDAAVREIAVLKLFNCKHIVQILSVSFERESINIRLPLYNCDLYKLAKRRVVSIVEIMNVAKAVAIALQYTHSYGIIHGDLKPENILVDERLTDIVLCDYGISVLSCEINHDPHIQTPVYRAPEIDITLDTQKFNQKIDIFSYGVVLLELASLKRSPENILNDTTIYWSTVYGIPIDDTRENRMCQLNDVHHLAVINMIREHVPADRSTIADAFGLTNLIARCLIPDQKRRVSSELLVSSFSCVPKKHNPVCDYKVCVDEMECIDGITSKIMSLLSYKCLQIMNNIYKRYIKATTNRPTLLTRYAILYIATCLFSGVADECDDLIRAEFNIELVLKHAVAVLREIQYEIF